MDFSLLLLLFNPVLQLAPVKIIPSYWVNCYSCHPLMCQNGARYRVLNWPPSEMTKSKTCHPPPFGEFRGGKLWTLPFLGVTSPGLCHFREWPVQKSFFLSPIWHIRKLWGGKNSDSPCILTF